MRSPIICHHRCCGNRFGPRSDDDLFCSVICKKAADAKASCDGREMVSPVMPLASLQGLPGGMTLAQVEATRDAWRGKAHKFASAPPWKVGHRFKVLGIEQVVTKIAGPEKNPDGTLSWICESQPAALVDEPKGAYTYVDPDAEPTKSAAYPGRFPGWGEYGLAAGAPGFRPSIPGFDPYRFDLEAAKLDIQAIRPASQCSACGDAHPEHPLSPGFWCRHCQRECRRTKGSTDVSMPWHSARPQPEEETETVSSEQEVGKDGGVTIDSPGEGALAVNPEAPRDPGTETGPEINSCGRDDCTVREGHEHVAAGSFSEAMGGRGVEAAKRLEEGFISVDEIRKAEGIGLDRTAKIIAAVGPVVDRQPKGPRVQSLAEVTSCPECMSIRISQEDRLRIANRGAWRCRQCGCGVLNDRLDGKLHIVRPGEPEPPPKAIDWEDPWKDLDGPGEALSGELMVARPHPLVYVAIVLALIGIGLAIAGVAIGAVLLDRLQ